MPNHLALELQDLGSPIGVSVAHEIADGGVVLGDAPGNGLAIDEAMIHETVVKQGWSQAAGPHVRPTRAGLRLVTDGTHPSRVVART